MTPRKALLKNVTTPANRKRHAQMFEETGLPTLQLDTPQALARFYRREGLNWRPGGR